MIVKNVNALYNSPKEVMSTVENEMVSVFAQSDKLAYDKFIGITRAGVTQYSIKIYFKDNRIKLEYPQISNVTFGSGEYKMTVSYAYKVGTYFDKKGEPKKKRLEWIKSIESYASKLCNRIVYGEEKADEAPKDNNDW